VGLLFSLLPTSQRDDIVCYSIDNAVIRKGFQELLQYCEDQNILFYVTSGGIDFFVYPLLAPFHIDESHIYCNRSNFSGKHIEIEWPHRCDEVCDNDCGMCKTKVIRSFPAEDYYRILIGDSVTDFEGAKLADLVFARSHLLEKCKEWNIPYIPYEDFFDVIGALRQNSIMNREVRQ
jgi:2-hydroxy-3-keto-5-methylthiopentenyl-1-phosphate phosphatase